jgi:hypothetical protein
MREPQGIKDCPVALPCRLMWAGRHQYRNRLAALGNQNLLAALDPRQQIRKLLIGLTRGDSPHFITDLSVMYYMNYNNADGRPVKAFQTHETPRKADRIALYRATKIATEEGVRRNRGTPVRLMRNHARTKNADISKAMWRSRNFTTLAK